MKKLITLISSFALAAFPLLAGAAVLTTPLTVGTLYPSLGGSTSISGSCGTAGANNTVTFALVQNGTTTPVSSASTVSSNATGGFSGTVILPSGFPSGSATLVATCSGSGDTVISTPLTFPAPTSTSLNVTGTPSGMGGLINLSGACGPSNGTGTVALSINSGGVNTQLGSTTLSSTGTFSSNNVIIPSNVGSGTATLTATCSNGTTFSSPITVNSPAINGLTVTPTPTLGGMSSVTGTCVGTPNANGTITFGLMRFGTIIPVSASGTTTGSTGGFNSTINLPGTAYGSGTADLVVTCPNGNTFTAAVNLLDPASLTGGTPGSVLGLDVGGVGAGETPVGGVAAGDPVSGVNWAIIIVLSLLCAAGIAFVIPLPSSENKHE